MSQIRCGKPSFAWSVNHAPLSGWIPTLITRRYEWAGMLVELSFELFEKLSG